jgi:hypothetical protein
MKSFIILICCILSGKILLAQIQRSEKSLRSNSVITQAPVPTKIATAANTPVTTKEAITTQPPVFSQAAVASQNYTRMKIKLPFATAEKEFFVQKMGHFFVLNGDIIVGNDFPKTMSYSNDDEDRRWANATLPIVVDPSIYTNNLGNEVHNAISMFNNRTELCLVQRTSEKNYIRIVYSTTLVGAGLSAVGCQGGEQSIFLASSASQGTVLHELMHAAGFYHEQCREDRDQFIKIIEDNIKIGQENNFQMEGGVARGDYDYCSIMHYNSTAFSKNNNPTMVCVQNGMTVACPPCLGTRTAFSDKDIIGIDKFYDNVSRFPCQTYFPNPNPQMKFALTLPNQSQAAMAAFSRSADLAAKEPPAIEQSLSTTLKTDQRNSNIKQVKFAGAYPNFHEANKGNNIVGATVFLKATAAQWQDVLLKDLGNPQLDDFAARMRATQKYAVQNGYVGGFPTFHSFDHGKGIVCGTVLIGHGGADWRNVPLSDLGNPPLDDIRARMISANNYAVKNGYLSGFPTFDQADYGKGIVCGIILIKREAGKSRDVIIIEGPR